MPKFQLKGAVPADIKRQVLKRWLSDQKAEHREKMNLYYAAQRRYDAQLERLAAVTVAALDKTGTLTEGQFAVVGQGTVAGGSLADTGAASSSSPSWTVAEVIKMAASVEACSSHPLAAAVVKLVAPCLAAMYGIVARVSAPA